MKIVVIPAKSQEEIKKAAKCLKVAAYCRVSTDDKEQKTSYEAQIQYYTDKINKNPEWQMAGIFADEGITGTQAKKLPEFLKMIRLCRQGKIDVILTKSLSRFARNTVDSLNYIRELRLLGIAVSFEFSSFVFLSPCLTFPPLIAANATISTVQNPNQQVVSVGEISISPQNCKVTAAAVYSPVAEMAAATM